MNPFNWTPTTGLNDISSFPSKDKSFRAHMQALLDQVKSYFNNDVTTELSNKANLSDFSNSLSGNGWRKSVDGTIEQWGSVNVTISTINQWTAFYANNFPIAFPNNCLNITCSLDPANQFAQVGATAPTKTQYNLYAKSEVAGTVTIKWRAIGN